MLFFEDTKTDEKIFNHRRIMADRSSKSRFSDERLNRLATVASVAVAALLVGGKGLAWLFSGSVAVLSSLADSGMDLIASAVTFYTIRFAYRPADRSHRYGHGKAEALGALGLAGFVGATAVLVSVAAVDRLIDPVVIRAPEFGAITMGLSVALTFGLVMFQTRVAERTGSLAIRADRLHYAGDLLTNVAALLALVVVEATGRLWVDPVAGIAIAVYLVWSAVNIARTSLHELLDREVPGADRTSIEAIVLADPDSVGMHDLRTRKTGHTQFIELHLELDESMPIGQAHEVADRIEGALKELYPAAQIIIHQEPAGIVDERLDDRLND
jgi:ferrous-iron efflux pump FieF